jgi:hypothetical protein
MPRVTHRSTRDPSCASSRSTTEPSHGTMVSETKSEASTVTITAIGSERV